MTLSSCINKSAQKMRGLLSDQKCPSYTFWYEVAAGLDACCTEQLSYNTVCLIPVDTANQLQ